MAMPPPTIPSVPVLSPDESLALEAGLFGGDELREWEAMVKAGRSVAHAILQDFAEIGGFPPGGRILVLAGKGHNTGDALVAAREILESHPQAEADVLFAFGPRRLKPLAARAWRELSEAARGRVRSETDAAETYDLCICGIIGFRYRPPLPPEALAAIQASGRCAVRLRAASHFTAGLDPFCLEYFRGKKTMASECK